MSFCALLASTAPEELVLGHKGSQLGWWVDFGIFAISRGNKISLFYSHNHHHEGSHGDFLGDGAMKEDTCLCRMEPDK